MSDSKTSLPGGGVPGYTAYDLAMAALLSLFALFSLAWPGSGTAELLGKALPRGYLLGPLFALLALGVALLGRLDLRGSPAPVRFVRTFYPQALFGPLFMESIRLSALPFGGLAHDGLFAAMDAAVFGYQPSVAFSAALHSNPFWNELMFGGYFSFYVILVVTAWIPWFKGDKEEAEREIAIFSFYMLFVYVFYVFFRVMGPKYWIPELAASDYTEFPGGPVTAFMCFGLPRSVLSGAAFPSSHVAVSLMMCSFVAKTERRLLPLYGLLTLLIALATVYIRAHWAADVAGGVLAALVLVPLFDRLRAPAQALADRASALAGLGAARSPGARRVAAPRAEAEAGQR